MSALNPKVSLLVKLAEIVKSAIDEAPVTPLVCDSEVLEWYDRMAELDYVPVRMLPAIAQGLRDGIANSPYGLFKDPLGKRVGYQTCANKEGQPEASYTEAGSVKDALMQCLIQFPPDDGYTKHSVKNIETQKRYCLPIDIICDGGHDLVTKVVNDALQEAFTVNSSTGLDLDEDDRVAEVRAQLDRENKGLDLLGED